MISFFFQCFWMYLLAGLGGMEHRSPTESSVIVAAFILYSFNYNVSDDILHVGNTAW